MSPRRVAAVFLRIVAQFRRDRRTLALLFVAPLAIIALLGWVLTSSQVTVSRVAVVDDSGTPAGAIMVGQIDKALTGQPNVELVTGVADIATARQMLIDNELDLVVSRPASACRTELSC
jgi:hypothetical protein